MCVCLCVYVHVSAGVCGGQRHRVPQVRVTGDSELFDMAFGTQMQVF